MLLFSTMKMKKIYSLLIIIFLFAGNTRASKLVEIKAADNQCLVLHFQDGLVEYNWDTPQQTFRQKIVLYGYLYGMNKRNN